MQSHHPLLINYRSVNINRHLIRNLKGNLYSLLYYFLHHFLYWIVHIYRLVNVDRFVHIYRLVDMNVNWLLNDFWRTGHPYLIRHFPLHFNNLLYLYNLLHNPLRTRNVLRHLDSHLYWFLNNYLSYSLFGYSSILILQLFL